MSENTKTRLELMRTIFAQGDCTGVRCDDCPLGSGKWKGRCCNVDTASDFKKLIEEYLAQHDVPIHIELEGLE